MINNMDKFIIDDISWNDLSMDAVYDKINTAQSSVGREYLKKILKTELFDEDALKARSSRADFFKDHKKITDKFKKVFKELGISKKISLYDYIFRFNELKARKNLIHYLLAFLLLAAAAFIFIKPVIGIIAVVVMFVVNISTYFKFKADVESYFMCFKYIVRMISAGKKLTKAFKTSGEAKHAAAAAETDGSSAVYDLVKTIEKDIRDLRTISKGSWLISNSVSGSLIDVLMDYVRMLFHVDIIKFNDMLKRASDKCDIIDELFCSLGELESDICISSYRQSLDLYCTPLFITWTPDRNASDKDHSDRISFTDVYHPLTEKIVKNSITVDRSVLLTGSNASGKSTFLKQLAINQILAQTIYTCLAGEVKTAFFKAISSMALNDNILANESYFIVEIKSLKRIFDEISELPVMCFVDEVLRGTNTRERIAASSQILKKLSEENALCFAASHDIELTDILKDQMDMYHFEEQVEGDDVCFDYKLKQGRAVSSNAIKLLEIYGFPKELVKEAKKMVEK